MTRSAPSDAHRAPFSGPPATAMTRAPAALPSWIPAVPSPLAAECTTSVSPGWRRPRLKSARCDVWNDSRNAVASASSNSGGASKTEMASAMAYSAMPPSAFLVMATTRLPSHDSAPSPAASTTPQTSMPSVKGGGVGTETRLPRQRSMSLKFSDAALTLPVPRRARARGARCPHRQDVARRPVTGHLHGPHVCHAPSPYFVGICPRRDEDLGARRSAARLPPPSGEVGGRTWGLWAGPLDAGRAGPGPGHCRGVGGEGRDIDARPDLAAQKVPKVPRGSTPRSGMG